MNGHADASVRFGDSLAQGSHGGTGIALYNGALYAEVNDRIVRYALPAAAIAPTAAPEVIVSGLPLSGDHPMHPFAIDRQGNLYVDLGSATNSCQVQNPKDYRSPMPPMGGAELSGADLQAVAAYVWALGHQRAH